MKEFIESSLVVGYTALEDCSTVLLRTKDKNEMVEVEFVLLSRSRESDLQNCRSDP